MLAFAQKGQFDSFNTKIPSGSQFDGFNTEIPNVYGDGGSIRYGGVSDKTGFGPIQFGADLNRVDSNGIHHTGINILGLNMEGQ